MEACQTRCLKFLDFPLPYPDYFPIKKHHRIAILSLFNFLILCLLLDAMDSIYWSISEKNGEKDYWGPFKYDFGTLVGTPSKGDTLQGCKEDGVFDSQQNPDCNDVRTAQCFLVFCALAIWPLLFFNIFLYAEWPEKFNFIPGINTLRGNTQIMARGIRVCLIFIWFCSIFVMAAWEDAEEKARDGQGNKYERGGGFVALVFVWLFTLINLLLADPFLPGERVNLYGTVGGKSPNKVPTMDGGNVQQPDNYNQQQQQQQQQQEQQQYGRGSDMI